jgi:methylmalonyl-CoA mutase N-terminal domain/subunit
VKSYGKGEGEREARSEEGIRLKVLYGPEDFKGEYETELGEPGSPPFTRGVYSTMYRGRPWTMRQYSGYGSAEETNRRFRLLLRAGQTGLSMAFDLPTQLGLDPDNPLAYYEVGRVGVPVPTWEEMGRVFKGIDISRVSTSMTINATAMELLSMYITLAESRGIIASSLSGTVQNDILKEFIARNNYIYPPGPSLRYAADIIEYCSKKMPRWNSISVGGYHFEEAGATPAQEIGFALADGLEYVKTLVGRGVDIDSFAPRISFFFSARSAVIEQVAKFRAARRLWCRLITERYEPKDTRSKMLRFHVQTAGVQMTSSLPLLNIARTTMQGIAAVLGGAQSLHVNSYDEALGLPTEEAAELSVRIQQSILLESDVASSADPLGGSYMLESLTDQIEEKARTIVERVEKLGGMVKAVEAGYPQKEIERASYEYQKRVESGEVPLVGVNVFRGEEESEFEVLKIDPVARDRVVRRVKELRGRRDSSAVEKELSRLADIAESDKNLFPQLLRCVRIGCTVGEISSTLRGVWGEWDRR